MGCWGMVKVVAARLSSVLSLGRSPIITVVLQRAVFFRLHCLYKLLTIMHEGRVA